MTLDATTGSRWWHEWGALCLIGLLALPLFTPRVYGSDEIKYFATLRSIYFDGDRGETVREEEIPERRAYRHLAAVGALLRRGRHRRVGGAGSWRRRTA